MTQPATITSVPPEIVCEILGHLSLGELVEKKRTCKLWNELICSQLKVTRVVVGSYIDKCLPWYQTPLRPVDEYLEKCNPNLFVSQWHRSILSHLKYLRLDVGDISKARLELNELNVFSGLLHLEVDHWKAWGDEQVELTLAKLEILKFVRYDSAGKGKLMIDCPRLQVLSWDCEKHETIEIKSPEAIRTLDIKHNVLKLYQFENLRSLKYRGEMRFVNVAMIEQLPNLKELYLYGALNSLYYDMEDLEAMTHFLRQLLSYRRKARRLDLRMFFLGVEIIDERLVDNLDFRMVQYGVRSPSKLSFEHLYFGSYPADCKPNLQDHELDFVQVANYNTLMDLVGSLPGDYFQRFWNVRELISRGTIRDPQHFTSFLKRLEFVRELTLLYPSLEQTWFDRLPTICARLHDFTLQEADHIHLNFDFLGQLEPYITWTLNRPLAITSAKSLLNLLKSFKEMSDFRTFRFKFRGADARIRMRIAGEDQDRRDLRACMELENDYDVLVDDQLKLQRVNSMEAVNYFEELEDNGVHSVDSTPLSK